MSYWVRPASDIPISCTTVQRLTKPEQDTSLWKQRIGDFLSQVRKNVDADSASLNVPSDIIQSGKFLSLESESPEFLEEYTRLIDSDEVKHVENKMCLGNEHKEIKPSTSNKRDSQVDGEENVTNAMPNNI